MAIWLSDNCNVIFTFLGDNALYEKDTTVVKVTRQKKG